MGWPSWTVHYSQGKGITQTFFLLPFLILTVCAQFSWFWEIRAWSGRPLQQIHGVETLLGCLGKRLGNMLGMEEANSTLTFKTICVFTAILAVSQYKGLHDIG